MRLKVAIIYNEPAADRYQAMGEAKAILGVLDEVRAVEQALVELGHDIILLPMRPPLKNVKNLLQDLQADLIFNLFEGFEGSPETEAMVARFIEDSGKPFTGCPAKALSLALDKAKTKAVLAAAGIATPGYQLLTPQNLSEFHLDFPCIIKPIGEDASHGITAESVVYDFPALEKQLLKVSRLFGGKALVEEFLDGREFNTTVVGNNTPSILAISEIVYQLPPGIPRILTFAAKWETESAEYQGTKPVCPADIGKGKEKEITRIALTAFRLLGCRGYVRVDLREDRKGQIHVLEVNPNPDISADSGAARQVKAAGMTYTQFIDKIIGLALEKENK